MPAYKNIVGQKFGMLTVLEELPGYKVLCLCDCGNKTIVQKGSIKSGHTTACGCRQHGFNFDINDIIGKRIGKLVVLQYSRKEGKSHCYLCKCDCGNIIEVRRSALINDKTKSCGCTRIETNIAIKESQKDNRYSKRKGVSYDSSHNNWIAGITYNYMYYNLGRYHSYNEAVAARDRAEEEIEYSGTVLTCVSKRPRTREK